MLLSHQNHSQLDLLTCGIETSRFNGTDLTNSMNMNTSTFNCYHSWMFLPLSRRNLRLEHDVLMTFQNLDDIYRMYQGILEIEKHPSSMQSEEYGKPLKFQMDSLQMMQWCLPCAVTVPCLIMDFREQTLHPAKQQLW